jgi:hypothetical protein
MSSRSSLTGKCPVSSGAPNPRKFADEGRRLGERTALHANPVFPGPATRFRWTAPPPSDAGKTGVSSFCGSRCPWVVQELGSGALRGVRGFRGDALQVRSRAVQQLRKQNRLLANHRHYRTTSSPMTKCGSHGPLFLEQLSPELAQAARPLKPGEIANPILFGAPTGTQSVVVVQRAPQSEVTLYEEVKEQMREKASADAMDRQRKQLLQELRRDVYIETRL